MPSVLQCDAPLSTFTKLNESEANVILGNFKTSCSDVDPAVSIPLKPKVKLFLHVIVMLLTDIPYTCLQISTALAGNIKTIDASTIINLGSQIVGLTTTQINLALPSVLISSLSTLSSTSGWSFGQVKAIIGVLLSGDFKVKFKSPMEDICFKISVKMLDTSVDH